MYNVTSVGLESTVLRGWGQVRGDRTSRGDPLVTYGGWGSPVSSLTGDTKSNTIPGLDKVLLIPLVHLLETSSVSCSSWVPGLGRALR